MEIVMKKFMVSVAVVCAMLFFVSCGGSSGSGEKDTGDTDEHPDSEVTDEESADSEITDADPADSEPQLPADPEDLQYPEVTTKSNEIGDIAQNITIYDDLDVKHKLAEWYKSNNPESKLIWLIFTTYDCPPCQILKEDLLEINKPEYREQGLKILLVFNGLLDGPQPELEPEKLSNYKYLFLSEYPDTAKFELYGYLRKEEQKVLRKFFSSPMGGAYPTWMFIDASTMELVEYGEGWGENMVKGTCDEIELLLEEL